MSPGHVGGHGQPQPGPAGGAAARAFAALEGLQQACAVGLGDAGATVHHIQLHVVAGQGHLQLHGPRVARGVVDEIVDRAPQQQCIAVPRQRVRALQHDVHPAQQRRLHAVLEQGRQIQRAHLRRLQFATCVVEHLLDHRVHALDVRHHPRRLGRGRELGAQAQTGQGCAQVVRHCRQHVGHLLRLRAQALATGADRGGQHLYFAWAIIGQRHFGLQVGTRTGFGQAAQRPPQPDRRPCRQRRQQYRAAQQREHHLPAPGGQIAVIAADHLPTSIGLAHAQFERRPLHGGQYRRLRLQHTGPSGRIEHRAALDDLHVGRLALPAPDPAHVLRRQSHLQRRQLREPAAGAALRGPVLAGQMQAQRRGLLFAAQHLHGLVQPHRRWRGTGHPADHRHADQGRQQQAGQGQHRDPACSGPPAAHSTCTAASKR